jgi:hypothetical protein
MPPASHSGTEQEAITVKPWTKWQDWTTLALGMLLVLAPVGLTAANASKCTLGATSWFSAPDSLDAWITGGVLIVVSLWALAKPGTLWTVWARAALGVWLIFAPWILGFTASSAATLTSAIAGAVFVTLAVWQLLETRPQQTKAPAV